MLQSFFPVGPNRNDEYVPAYIPECYGGDERYLYSPNWYDQTVSIIDTDLCTSSNRNTLSITSLSRTSNVSTAQTASNHGLSNGQLVWLTGVTPATFQGGYSITVTGLNTFTYSNTGTDSTGSGTMLLNWWTTNPVISTITLTAAKNFCAIFYRAVDDSVYVFGDSYFDRIDADPNSGTFNTLVESGSASATTDALNLTYVPWPLDILTNSSSTYRFHRFINKDNTSAATSDYNMFARNPGGYNISNNNSLGQATFGHTIGWARLAPRAGIMFFRSEQSYKYRILISKKGLHTNGQYTFVQEPWQMDLDRVGLVGSGYIFDNSVLPSSSGSVYRQLRGMDTSPIGTIVTNGGVSPNYAEYCPINGRTNPTGSYVYAGRSGTSMAVFTVGANVYTDLGDIDKSGHRAGSENATDSIIHNHRNNKLFVRGYSTLTLPGVVNLIHIYDLTQSLANMYLGSVPVGNLISTKTVRAMSMSNMTFNQTKYYEANGVTL